MQPCLLNFDKQFFSILRKLVLLLATRPLPFFPLHAAQPLFILFGARAGVAPIRNGVSVFRYRVDHISIFVFRFWFPDDGNFFTVR